MESIKLETQLGEEKLTISSGKIALQTNGSVTVQYGDTVILATVVMSRQPREGIDFLPLLVDYEERLYAAGKISSSRFIKREGRPSDEAILTARLTDRSFRPLFPKQLHNDIQIIVTVLSVDIENDPAVASIIGASAALCISDIPFSTSVGAVRVGRVGDQLVLNPKYNTRQKSDLDLIISATKDKIIMIEVGANQAPEEVIEEGIEFGHKYIKKIIHLQEKLISKIGKKKEKAPQEEIDPKLLKKIDKFLVGKLEKVLREDKLKRDKGINNLRDKLIESLGELEEEEEKEVGRIFSQAITEKIRKDILQREKRVDGRKLDEIRPISCQVGVLPRTHGSGLFSRGYTQILTIATLGASSAEQVLEGLKPETTKRFMHHYNFPPFSVGETAYLRAPSRREIGHGALAEKALAPVTPKRETFPYTIRLVSEVLSSDGSTSMGSVCGSSLALMDAGIPISAPVAGIAMGLIIEDQRSKIKKVRKSKILQKENYKILTDITGLEDYCGDMDLKIAGTQKGITALQMDIKLSGITLPLVKEVLQQAKKARLTILQKITNTISHPRPELSPYAPRVTTLHVNPDKIRDIIGPAGKTINKIIAETGVEIDIEPEGTVNIFSPDSKQIKKAVSHIRDLTREVKVGEIYSGKITKITDFGAFVEILPGQEGLVHISQLSPYRVENVKDVVKVGDEIPVKVIGIDEQGRINLSRKVLTPRSKKGNSNSY
jgi:polyribonucleotide nucleotidyltransferase